MQDLGEHSPGQRTKRNIESKLSDVVTRPILTDGERTCHRIWSQSFSRLVLEVRR